MLRGADEYRKNSAMRQNIRIAVGTVILAPIVAAFLLTGFPVEAASPDTGQSLADPGVGKRIDRSVRDNCRKEVPGSVEHSICLAEGRKNAYRAAAEERKGNERRPEGVFTLR